MATLEEVLKLDSLSQVSDPKKSNPVASESVLHHDDEYSRARAKAR